MREKAPFLCASLSLFSPCAPTLLDCRYELLCRSRTGTDAVTRPLTVHVILLVTNYYNTSTTDRAREVYAGLNAIVHELLVGHILAPDPSMFTRDLVRAFLLLLYYKPIQTAAYAHRGLKSSSRIVHASKINALSSLMLHSLIQRAATFQNVPQSPALLTRVLDNFDLAPPQERKRALAEFRLWCTVVAADALGSLQSGRLTWTDPADALRVTRRFASFAADPTDVRRASILELYSIVTLPTSMTATSNPVRYRLENLKRINAELDAWKAYWSPILAEMQTRGDPLAYTVVQTSAQFVILAVNGAVFTRWDLERKKELEQGKEGRPKLTKECVPNPLALPRRRTDLARLFAAIGSISSAPHRPPTRPSLSSRPRRLRRTTRCAIPGGRLPPTASARR